MENIPEVMYLANKYMVAECMDACTKYLTDNLTTTNVCWVYELAILHERQQLKQICDEHITSNAETLLKSDEFLSCSQKSLREILKMDLHCKESIVFDRCLAWAKNACQQNGLDENDGSNLRNQLGKCLFLIRFGTMRIQEFSEATLKCKGMFTADELCDVMGSITLNGFFSKKFNQVPRRFWDESKVWRCKPKPLKRVAFQIQFLESVFFTSNKMTLLGGIYIPNVWGERSFSAKATVVEIKGHSFATEAGTILFEEDKNFVCNAEGYVKLPTPIIINPSNSYEICLEVTSTTVNLLTSKWDLGEVPSMNGLIIKFKHIYLNSVHMSFGLELIDF
ncbi:uncharacterized protein LOC116346036 [Contarinia nasturtii]|uniref:uncharacterized protein LOC116346036 n=1 Tax=Contarinia nasturtii TaxID=265458 RepID=UPI0012D38051|nr:uncharacterized protein LOC116346036 [Contarinia nasturtii]